MKFNHLERDGLCVMSRLYKLFWFFDNLGLEIDYVESFGALKLSNVHAIW